MKLVLRAIVALLLVCPVFIAWKKTPPPPKPAAEEIHWITSFDELQARMQQNPKKVYVDVYTNWCGWCKKMDATTFRNPSLIKYMNANYYAVRFDAERQDVIHFQGKEYAFNPQYKCNQLAADWLGGNMEYPSAVILMENFQNPQVLKGYLDITQAETVLTYFGDNMFRHQNGEAYKTSYKPRWSNGQTVVTPPPGH